MFCRPNIENEFPGTRWLVYRFDISRQKIVLYNVLRHPEIVKLCRMAGKHIRLKTFEAHLTLLVCTEFSGRAQWEFGLSDKFPRVTAAEVERLQAAKNAETANSYEVDVLRSTSGDVAEQLWMNWKPFLHYVFRHRAEIVADFDDYCRAITARCNLKLSGE